MCHSSSSWSEIQYPHQNLIYDQPVGRGQGGQSPAFLQTAQRGNQMHGGLRRVACRKSSAKALAQTQARVMEGASTSISGEVLLVEVLCLKATESHQHPTLNH